MDTGKAWMITELIGPSPSMCLRAVCSRWDMHVSPLWWWQTGNGSSRHHGCPWQRIICCVAMMHLYSLPARSLSLVFCSASSFRLVFPISSCEGVISPCFDWLHGCSCHVRVYSTIISCSGTAEAQSLTGLLSYSLRPFSTIVLALQDTTLINFIFKNINI